ncbi:hypothetical protein PGN35_005560 [Nodosilinea sp. PGN35]|uniref:hypothetical protein n=1 Tax=Nodosilinea sp. PGN35 TaxID=3020489 RepID=UPI0023B2CBE0|nr:hypothetical protein [Nodosilinea sp. TSF1-S3]MDF0367868.1 hypothetical protein [Nodosilinea sp. TSF1-S3]
MWQPLKNFVNSLTTYMALSPDMVARQRVNQWLRSRRCLTCDEWYRYHWTPPAVPCPLPKPLIDFAYQQLTAYSGLEIGRVQPSDLLVEDLSFPAVCWFDWGLTLCEDFYNTFGLDISEHFDETQLLTCADLIGFLDQQLESGKVEE